MTAVGVELVRAASDGAFTMISGRCHPSPTAVARAVRFAVQPALLDAGWLLLHASSVRLEGGVHLFLAPSGTGKTTLARRLAQAGATLLGDEVALVTPGHAGVFPLQPLAGDAALLAPLAAVHVLRQGAPSSTPLTHARAAAELLAQTMVYETGAVAMERSFDLAVKMASHTPAFTTHIPNDYRAVEHLVALARSLA
jgi:type II secretory pathway predicted ATPase ExeA